MKAIVKKYGTVGVWMEDRPVPEVGETDVLIKIRSTSICGTDVHLYEWDEWAQKTLPIGTIIGHEFIGTIAQLGSKVTGLTVGQRVSGEGHITCGQCRQCNTGRRVLCPNTIGVGVNRDGCFAEYLCIPAENVFPVPDDIPDDIASILDPLGNSVHTTLAFGVVGENVLITGAGPIGLMTIAVAHKAGARQVVITDINDYRLDLAKKMGATRTVNVKKEKLEDVMRELGIDNGFDSALEMSGSPEAFATLPDVVTHGGHIVILGILPSNATLDWHKVIFKMLTIKGIYGRVIFRTWYQMTAMVQSGLDVSPVITHRFPADEFQKGFDTMRSGKSGKVVLDWTI